MVLYRDLCSLLYILRYFSAYFISRNEVKKKKKHMVKLMRAIKETLQLLYMYYIHSVCIIPMDNHAFLY